MSLAIDRHVCEEAPFWTNDRLEWISLAALLLASIHGMLIGHYFLKLTKQLDKLQEQYDKRVEQHMSQQQIEKRQVSKLPDQKLVSLMFHS